jgi:hypothetical protein
MGIIKMGLIGILRRDRVNNLGYIINGNRAAKLISSNIYSQVSSIVEMLANYYDVDATEIRIILKETKDSEGNIFITEIIISGDGEGFSLSDLNNIREIGNSKKRTDMHTKKFKRVKLGSFGIALTSFQNLGNELEIYSKTESKTILYEKIIVKNELTTFTDIKEVNCNDLIRYDTGCTFIIKNCNISKSVFFEHDLLKNKLSYLPINENFKIYLNEEKIERVIVDCKNSFNLTFKFNIDDVECIGNMYYSTKRIDNMYFRGVFLQIDGRIIDWNIFNDIRQSVTTPGAVEYRIQGYIFADGLRNKINASRDGLTDTNLALRIADILKKNIRSINDKAKKYYGYKKSDTQMFIEKNNKKNNNSSKIINIKNIAKEKNCNEIVNVDSNIVSIEKEEIYNISKRKEKAIKKIKNINNDLKRLGIKFCYEPESEIEVIVIASQMWQEGLLDFSIIQVISSGSPDSIVIKDGKQAFLEFEQSLNNFYIHEHNHYSIDYIICWDINQKAIEKNRKKYLEKYSKYLKSIQLKEKVEDLYWNELIFNDYDGTQHIVKLCVISEVIKK